MTGADCQVFAKTAVTDPFLIRGSEEVTAFPWTSRPVFHVSVDVKDMFFNIPSKPLLKAVEECTEDFGEARFVEKKAMCS